MFKILTTIIALPLLMYAAEWQSLNGPPVGSAVDMSIGQHPLEQYWVIYAAETYWNREPKRIYKSTDLTQPLGEYWDSLVHYEIEKPTCVVTPLNDARIVYMGKVDDDTPEPPYDVIFKSIDGGRTWFRVSDENVINRVPKCFAMDHINENVVYVGFDWYMGVTHCMFKTTNGGISWQACGDLNHSVRDILIHPDNTQILYSATDNSIWRSTNYGASWIRLDPPGGLTNVYCVTIKTCPAPHPDTLYAAVHDVYASTARIYKTSVDDIQWIEIFSGGYYPSSLVIDKSNSDVMFATFCLHPQPAGQAQPENPDFSRSTGGLYKSTDKGETWFSSSNGIVEKTNYYALTQHPSIDGMLFVSTTRAIYKSTDNGDTWNEKTKGFKLPIVSHISVQDLNVYVNSANLVSKSGDGGANWCGVHQMANQEGPIAIAPSNTEIVYASFSNFVHVPIGDIDLSIDGGVIWSNSLQAGFAFSDITIAGTNSDIVYVSAYNGSAPDFPRVYRTTDGGHNWSYCTFGWRGKLNTIEVDPTVNDILYTGGKDAYGATKLYKSINGGVIFEPRENGLPGYGTIKTLAIDPINVQILYTGGDIGIFKSTNGADFWVQKTNGFLESSVEDLKIDPEEPAIIYALGKSGTNRLYCSVDGANQWFQFTFPQGQNPPTYIREFGIDRYYADRVYVTTHNGVYIFKPKFINKHLTSSSYEATFANNGRKLLYVYSTDELW
ncbi:MAG: WD40/YVTN/BNR-like repeat-containing protein, partial [bacterium]